MVTKLKWKAFKGWRIRVVSAVRCLFYRHYVLVAWEKCEDGDLDFRVTHKGVELPEAVHRLKVDAVEILQGQCDQEDAVFEAIALTRRKDGK
jgi:hypothetical protein